MAPGATRATWARQAPSPWTAARRRFIRSRTGLLGTFVLLVVTLMAVFAAQVAPYNPTRQDFRVEREPPSLEHLMGTDEFGRDVLSRVIWGARASLAAGTVAASIALAVARNRSRDGRSAAIPHFTQRKSCGGCSQFRLRKDA